MQRLILFGFYRIVFFGIGCFLLSERFSECTCSLMVQPKSFCRMVGRGWPLEFAKWWNFWVWSHKQDLVSWQNDASLCADISTSNNQQVSGKSQPHKVFERDVTHIGEPSKYIKNSSQNICSSRNKHLWQSCFFCFPCAELKGQTTCITTCFVTMYAIGLHDCKGLLSCFNSCFYPSLHLSATVAFFKRNIHKTELVDPYNSTKDFPLTPDALDGWLHWTWCTLLAHLQTWMTSNICATWQL